MICWRPQGRTRVLAQQTRHSNKAVVTPMINPAVDSTSYLHPAHSPHLRLIFFIYKPSLTVCWLTLPSSHQALPCVCHLSLWFHSVVPLLTPVLIPFTLTSPSLCSFFSFSPLSSGSVSFLSTALLFGVCFSQLTHQLRRGSEKVSLDELPFCDYLSWWKRNASLTFGWALGLFSSLDVHCMSVGVGECVCVFLWFIDSD